MSAAYSPVQSEGAIVFPFDARGIARRFRHAAIFAALEMLRPGETIRLVSDCELSPLLGEMHRRYGMEITNRAVEREPTRVVVDLTRT